MQAGKNIRIVNWAFTGLWMALLFSGIGFKVSAKLAGWPDFDSFTLRENREPERFPDLRKLPPEKWGAGVEAWYNDNFAWRARLIQFYRHVHFAWLKTAVAQEVPGRRGWVFRCGGNWAELEDYLGAFELGEEELRRWLVLFEGRTAWAEAHGTVWLYAITPVKAQIHPEMVFPMIAAHRGPCVREQVRAALAGSPAENHVLFLSDVIAAATREKPVFYKDDHHVNGYGTWLIYDAVVRRLRDFLPGLPGVPPLVGTPPPEAVERCEAPGCFVVDERLCVRMPGMHETKSPLFGLFRLGGRRPVVSVAVEQEGERRTVVMGNDSFMRFSLAGWHFEKDRLCLPFGAGFDRMVSLLFMRFSTERLEQVVEAESPACIIEQFPEVKLTAETVGYDETMERAAAWLHGTAAEGTGRVQVLATFRGVEADGDGPVRVVLRDAAGNALAEETVPPGRIRAVFFGEAGIPAGGASLDVLGGRAESAELQFRTAWRREG